MIKTVANISRKNFDRINFYPVSNPPSKDTHAYVSIYGNDHVERVPPRINHGLWMTGIQLQFDDTDRSDPVNNLHLISDEQSISLVQFLIDLHYRYDPVHVIVHCYAGISRSAAVGKFADDVFKLDLPNYQKLSLYNRAVYRQLVDAWNKLSM